VDARDVADAHARALVNRGAPYECYVVSGAPPFHRDDVDALAAADAPTVLAAREPDVVASFEARGWTLPAAVDRIYDPERARAALGWAPRYGWAEVLAEYDRESPEVLHPPSTRTDPAPLTSRS